MLMAKRSKGTEARALELSCRCGPFVRESYILKGSTLEVRFRSPLESEDFVVDLPTLDPAYSRYRGYPRRWTSTAVALALSTVVLGVLCAQGHVLGLNAWIWVLPALTLLGTAWAAAQALWLRKDCVSFHRLDDGVPTVNLPWKRPDPDTFDQFVCELKGRIERCQLQSEEGGLAAELRGLSRLLREGGLSEQEFRAAKATLLGLEPWQLGE